MILPDVYAVLKDDIVKWYPLFCYFVMMQLRVRFYVGIISKLQNINIPLLHKENHNCILDWF